MDYCNSATRLLGIDSQPEEPGTITMGAALLKQVDSAHLRGFKVTRRRRFISEALTYLDISGNDYDKAELDATLRKVGLE